MKNRCQKCGKQTYMGRAVCYACSEQPPKQPHRKCTECGDPTYYVLCKACAQGVYEPTPEEIRERAAVISAGWTEAERRRRAGIPMIPVELLEFTSTKSRRFKMWERADNTG